MDLDNVWLIRHREELFWRPNANGYTSLILGAGVYREEEAKRLASNRPDDDKPVALATVLGWVEEFQGRGTVYELIVGRLTALEADLKDAAGDMPIPLPEPGTVLAKMLTANALLRRQVSDLKIEVELHKSGDRPCIDAIDRCFEIVDGSPEWDYPGQLVHLVEDLHKKVREAEEERAAREPKSLQALVDSCNDLARSIYALQGYVVKDGFRFYESKHPHELACWRIAAEAYEHIEGRDIQGCLDELQEAPGNEER